MKPTLDDYLQHGYSQVRAVKASTDSLEHYGVKGMKWGKHKVKVALDDTSGGGGLRPDRNHNDIKSDQRKAKQRIEECQHEIRICEDSIEEFSEKQQSTNDEHMKMVYGLRIAAYKKRLAKAKKNLKNAQDMLQSLEKEFSTRYETKTITSDKGTYTVHTKRN